MPTTRQGLNSAAIEQLITQHVADAMTAYEANQNSDNGVKIETSRSAGGVEHAVHSCSYKEFLTCKPLVDGCWKTPWYGPLVIPWDERKKDAEL
ncbi:hypothetical protein Tco_0820173 [Tanacetum coccineum]|uniref:Uncharacterized protein n=1 Tax=Tanacetum coccineum TaxID=301880 RepID=A0ABQ5ADD7_9ASTR